MKDEIIFELQLRGADIIIWDAKMDMIEARVPVSRGELQVKIFLSFTYLIVRDLANGRDRRYSGIIERFHDVNSLIRILESDIEYLLEDKFFILQFREAILPVGLKGDKILKNFHFIIKPFAIRLFIGLLAILILMIFFL